MEHNRNKGIREKMKRSFKRIKKKLSGRKNLRGHVPPHFEWA